MTQQLIDMLAAGMTKPLIGAKSHPTLTLADISVKLLDNNRNVVSKAGTRLGAMRYSLKPIIRQRSQCIAWS